MIIGEVGIGHVARVSRVAAHGGDDRLGDRPAVEGIGTLGGDAAERLGEIWITQQRADRQRLAIGLVEQGTGHRILWRSEEHTSELQSLMRISYAVFCLKKKKCN